MRVLLGTLAGIMALWLATAAAQTPSPSPSPAVEGLRYRLQVYGRVPNSFATDGSRLVVNSSGRAEPCAEGTIIGGRTEIVVRISETCSEGLQTGITLFLVGEIPITARAEPPLEWRRVRPAETGV